jgi:predicted dehydrogenase
MNIAFVGCGYVADFYATTLQNHKGLHLARVFDRDRGRLEAFCRHWKVSRAESLEQLLDDKSIELVVNLTNPGSHFAVSQAALEAGKHVYSEKPLSLSFTQAQELVELAQKKGVQLSGAPCSLLGEAAQTAWKALREGRIGTPRLAYAELDDGPIHLLGFQEWKSASGAAWPWADELEVGCMLEHAGYYVGWLLAFFGPVRSVTAFNALAVPEKGVATPDTPDFNVACLEHESGVSSRITCSIFASHDHSLRVFGDQGVLHVNECWDYGSAVGWYPRRGVGLKAEKRLAAAHRAGVGLVPIPLVRKAGFKWKTRGANRMDFARGVWELAEAVGQKRPVRLNAQFSLHLNELVLALLKTGTTQLTTRCEVPAPMPWAV